MKKEYDFSKGRRGSVVPVPPGKLRITIRIDRDVLEWFKAKVDAAGGGNYQTMMNDALRQVMTGERQPLEASLRRVMREELAAYGKPSRSKPKSPKPRSLVAVSRPRGLRSRRCGGSGSSDSMRNS